VQLCITAAQCRAVNELHHPAAATICAGWRRRKQEHTSIKAAVHASAEQLCRTHPDGASRSVDVKFNADMHLRQHTHLIEHLKSL